MAKTYEEAAAVWREAQNTVRALKEALDYADSAVKKIPHGNPAEIAGFSFKLDIEAALDVAERQLDRAQDQLVVANQVEIDALGEGEKE